jgi:signal transduction histidine kinase
VLKEHMTRLAPALARELEESATRSKLKTSEAMLERTEKLRSLGQMAAGISHDLKNLLNPLALHLQMAERALDAHKLGDVKEALGEMKGAIARGVQVIDRLRDYSRQTPESVHQQVDLRAIALEASELARPRMGTRAGRKFDLVQDCVPVGSVLGHQTDLVSAVLNLLVNAVDAMPSGGTVTIRTGASDGKVWLAVSDDGVGMPRDVRDHIFEPFFTTKGAEGTGLGLAMVYACVVRHGGDIDVQSEPGKGSTFTLRFPVAPST